jgi:nitrate/nitrite-specific signal transduction histidine kinase
VARHAQAEALLVGLRYGKSQIHLTIRDDGVGVPPLQLRNDATCGAIQITSGSVASVSALTALDARSGRGRGRASGL